jgi:uncharacterized protein YndB with AHSA1/START domain
MPIPFEVRERIAAPPERVFRALVDVDRMGEWMPGFVRLERLTPGPLRRGSQVRETRKMFGHEASEVFEVTELEPPTRLALHVDGTKGSSKRGWFRFRYDLTPAAGGTDLRMTGEAGGLSGCMSVFAWLMSGPMKKAIRKDLLAQKAWIERGGGPPPA